MTTNGKQSKPTESLVLSDNRKMTDSLSSGLEQFFFKSSSPYSFPITISEIKMKYYVVKLPYRSLKTVRLCLRR